MLAENVLSAWTTLQESSEGETGGTEHERSGSLNSTRVAGRGSGARLRSTARARARRASCSGSLARGGGGSRATSRDSRGASVSAELIIC